MIAFRRSRRALPGSLAGIPSAATLALIVVAAPAHPQFESPTEVSGDAALEHPATRAIIEAARLLVEGRLAELRSAGPEDVRAEWASMSAEEQREDTERARERAPDPDTFAAEVARIGVLTLYGDSATLRLPLPDGDGVSAMAFASLDGGVWKVTGGPMTFEPDPVETGPAITGEAILEHEIGELALEYSARLGAGDLDAALDLLSGPARAKRASYSDEERRSSDAFRLQHLPAPSVLAEQIRNGGHLSFAGDMAYLSVVSQVVTKGDDDATTYYSSTTTSLPFELQDGAWRIGD
jgi:hypothetical protein